MNATSNSKGPKNEKFLYVVAWRFALNPRLGLGADRKKKRPSTSLLKAECIASIKMMSMLQL